MGQIVDEECLRRNRNATPQFIGALTEMVWTQIGTSFFGGGGLPQPISERRFAKKLTLTSVENVAIDLESFCNHANRANVTTDDVLLLARKNPDLGQIMAGFVEERKAIKGKVKSRAKAGLGRR